MSVEQIQTQFEKAASDIKSWNPKSSPSNEDKLALYALYKQATEGDVTPSRPSIFNQVNRAKWDAWKAKEGMTKEDAMKKYIEEVARQRSAYA